MLGVYTIDELTNAQSNGKMEFVYEVDDPKRACELITEGESVIRDESHFELGLQVETARETAAEINKRLVGSGVKLYTVSVLENKKLEDVFIELTQSGGAQID